MDNGSWIKEFPQAIKVCSTSGIVIEMNDKAIQGAKKYGGSSLIGRNILDVHSEGNIPKVQSLLNNPRINCYTIEKDGIKSLIYQCPWYNDGEFMGYVELSLEIPFKMPHYIRTP